MDKEGARDLAVAEAGAMGGTTTYAKYGREHFRAMGKKGQASLAAKVTTFERRIWGSMGGRPKKRRSLDKGEKREYLQRGLEPAR